MAMVLLLKLSDWVYSLKHSEIYSKTSPVTIVTSDPWEWERNITEKFSVMGTIFNPTVREAMGSLYNLHTSEIEHTSFQW